MVRIISLFVEVFSRAFGYGCFMELLPTFFGVIEGFGCEFHDDLLVVTEVLCEGATHLADLFVFLLFKLTVARVEGLLYGGKGLLE